jgi:succinyl-diaminopimelate desuccinylase
MHEEILRTIESLSDWAVELQRGLTALPAICPSSGGEGEYDKALWLDGVLRTLAFDSIDWYNAADPNAKNGIRPNIVARYRGLDSRRTLWIMSHLDIVPPGDRSQWRTDPYTLHVEDGTLYGRGVEDNQQAIASSLLVARALQENGVRPPIDLALLFCADEETGSDYGAEHLAEQHRDLFGPHDAFLVPDGGSADGSMVEIAEKSLWWLRVHTLGTQCHASTPQIGANAFRAASDLVTRLSSLYSTFATENPLYDPPMSTFEPTKKDANVPNINTIPGEDVFYLDSRVLPEVPLAAVEAEIARLAREVEQQHKVEISFQSVQRAEAAPPTSADAPVVRWLSEAIVEVLGVTPRPQGIGGGTVAAIFRRLGLPAVVYSKLEETAHQPNESCRLPNLVADAKVLALTALKATPDA